MSYPKTIPLSKAYKQGGLEISKLIFSEPTIGALSELPVGDSVAELKFGSILAIGAELTGQQLGFLKQLSIADGELVVAEVLQCLDFSSGQDPAKKPSTGSKRSRKKPSS